MPSNDEVAKATALQPKTANRNLNGGLRTPGLLGKWPLIGLMMILIGGIVFGVLAFSVQTNGPLIQNDTQIDNNLHVVALQSSPIIRDTMIFGFYLGEYGVVVIGIVLAVYFLRKRYWTELSMILVAWIGEAALWVGLSQLFHRARPTFDVSVWRQMSGPGFPSGHSIGTVMCFGLLAYLLVPKVHSYIGKVILIVVAVLISLYIGFSRLFVGDHYLTDVIAGYALGFFWAGLVYTSAELISKRKKQRKATISQSPA